MEDDKLQKYYYDKKEKQKRIGSGAIRNGDKLQKYMTIVQVNRRDQAQGLEDYNS